MAKLIQTNTVGSCSADVMCSGGTNHANRVDRLAQAGGSVGSTEVTFDGGNSALTNNVFFMFDCAIDANISWDAGTWEIPINFTSFGARMTLQEVHVCRVNSSCVNQESLGSLTGIGRTTTGVYTANVTGSAATPSAGDRVAIVLLFDVADGHGGNTTGITPDQTITSPFKHTITAEKGTYSLTGQAVGLKKRYPLTIDSGSYTITGQAVNLKKVYKLSADAGSYSLSGQAVTLTYTPVGGGAGGFISVPRLADPSYSQGFARNAHESMHPNLWEGLRHAWCPMLGHAGKFLEDIVGGNVATQEGLTPSGWKLTKYGHAIDAVDNADWPPVHHAPTTAVSNDTNAATMICGFSTSASAGLGYVVAAPFGLFGVNASVESSNLQSNWYGLSNIFMFSNTGSAAILGDYHVYAATWDGSNKRNYLDGVLQNSNSTTGTLDNSGTLNGLFGSSNNSGRGLDGSGFFVYLYDRALRPKEIELIHNDPLALFRSYVKVPFSTAAGPTVYTLSADAGTYSSVGQAVNLKKVYKLSADAGSYSSVGQTVNLKKVYKLLANVGSYSVNGQAVNLKKVYKLLANVGSYSSVGQVVNLKKVYKLPVDVGSYSVNGQTVNLKKVYKLLANVGSYSVNGQAVTLTRVYTLSANAGTYSVTGQTVGLRKTYRLSADAGSYAVSGQIVNLINAYRLLADAGTYSVTGQTVGLRKTYRLSADAGVYTVDGKTVNLINAYRLLADAGVYSSVGQAVSLKKIYRINAEAGSYATSGQAVDLRKRYTLSANAGVYTTTGQSVSVKKLYKILANVGVYSLVGKDVTLTAPITSNRRRRMFLTG